MNSENLSELTHKALLKVRQKLLDLSKRNRLLNFKETARSIRIIDELPDQVFKALVTEAKSMALVPIEEIEDKDIKIPALFNQNTEKEGKITKDKLNDLCLQTPYTSTVLERRCKRIHQDAKTAIEETGSNFLHLCIDFLEWPTTKEEFKDNIPLKLRESIAWDQLQFLDDIFQIIEEALHY